MDNKKDKYSENAVPEFDKLVSFLIEESSYKGVEKALVNRERVGQVLFVYEGLKEMFKDKKVKIEYGLHEPFAHAGFVVIKGSNLKIDDPDVFFELSKFADSLEVFPLLNGSVEITFGFRGLVERT